MKRACFAVLLLLISVSMQAQLSVKWGSIDERYPVEAAIKVSSASVNSATAWRGERVNLQLLVADGQKASEASKNDKEMSYRFSELKNAGHVIPATNVVGGFVQHVITDRFIGCGKHEVDAYGENLVADRITDTNPTLIPAGGLRGLWLTVQVPRDAKPGTYKGYVELTCEGKKTKHIYTVKVLNRTLPAPADWNFHLDLWQNPYAIARVHNVELWSKEHFNVMRPYMLKLASAGQKAITATLIDRPWDGQTYDPFGSMVTWVRKADGTWWYDFTIFDRWVEFMMECGIGKEITCFSMIPWKLSFRYYDQATHSHKYINCAPGEEAYAQFWGGMLNAFAAHLKEKGWFEKTFISMDERSLQQMQAAIKVIKEYAPGLKISMAGNYHPEIEADIYDYCLDIFAYGAYTPELIAKRRAEGKVSTYYTCCSAEYPNLFTFSAPADAEFIALEALAKDLDGYLRWAYNSWTVTPEDDSRFTAWPAGDTYVIYPFSLSSVRWERLVQGIQQFEKYKILLAEAEASGNASRVKALKKMLGSIDIKKISTDSENIVNGFRNSLNSIR
ncbi:MAG: DUF4091 domain-containing protein [Bacteroidaceae bacterium]|nr:DUF4091 domain-containing protein [Bacteroidaceae bacterium]